MDKSLDKNIFGTEYSSESKTCTNVSDEILTLHKDSKEIRMQLNTMSFTIMTLRNDMYLMEQKNMEMKKFKTEEIISALKQQIITEIQPWLEGIDKEKKILNQLYKNMEDKLEDLEYVKRNLYKCEQEPVLAKNINCKNCHLLQQEHISLKLELSNYKKDLQHQRQIVKSLETKYFTEVLELKNSLEQLSFEKEYKKVSSEIETLKNEFEKFQKANDCKLTDFKNIIEDKFPKVNEIQIKQSNNAINFEKKINEDFLQLKAASIFQCSEIKSNQKTFEPRKDNVINNLSSIQHQETSIGEHIEMPTEYCGNQKTVIEINKPEFQVYKQKTSEQNTSKLSVNKPNHDSNLSKLLESQQQELTDNEKSIAKDRMIKEKGLFDFKLSKEMLMIEDDPNSDSIESETEIQTNIGQIIRNLEQMSACMGNVDVKLDEINDFQLFENDKGNDSTFIDITSFNELLNQIQEKHVEYQQKTEAFQKELQAINKKFQLGGLLRNLK